VAQAIAKRSHVVPRLIRHQSAGERAELRRGLADSLKATLDCIAGLPICLERCEVHLSRVALNCAHIVDYVC
jgi:hypothetical protein